MREHKTDQSSSMSSEGGSRGDCKHHWHSTPSLHTAQVLEPRQLGGLKQLSQDLEWFYQLSRGLQIYVSWSSQRSDPGTHTCRP